MPNISLRLPYLIYLSIASILLGVLLSPLFRSLLALTTPETMREHFRSKWLTQSKDTVQR